MNRVSIMSNTKQKILNITRLFNHGPSPFRTCQWPSGEPGTKDFHFCGEPVNPGFPYCVEHCGRAYQAQLPRGTRRPPPPLPFGGPRVR